MPGQITFNALVCQEIKLNILNPDLFEIGSQWYRKQMSRKKVDFKSLFFCLLICIL